jgi:hypothetical protein
LLSGNFAALSGVSLCPSGETARCDLGVLPLEKLSAALDDLGKCFGEFLERLREFLGVEELAKLD